VQEHFSLQAQLSLPHLQSATAAAESIVANTVVIVLRFIIVFLVCFLFV
jgi:hypothetical protein